MRCSEPAKAAEMMHLFRAHCGIEKQLHRVLDVSWAENACLIRDKVAARNIATLSKMTLDLARLAQT
jgi:predicted transposase YbfD/YdcC